VLRAPHARGTVEEAPNWYRAVMTMRMAEILRITEAMMPLIVIGIVANMTEAGAFRVAVSIAALGSIAVSVAHLALPPLFAQLNVNGDTHRMKRLASISALVITMPSVVLLLLSLALGEWAIVNTFGKDFTLAAVPTSIC
jgi:O-antigen/teichoic acid export membrane protein